MKPSVTLRSLSNATSNTLLPSSALHSRRAHSLPGSFAFPRAFHAFASRTRLHISGRDFPSNFSFAPIHGAAHCYSHPRIFPLHSVNRPSAIISSSFVAYMSPRTVHSWVYIPPLCAFQHNRTLAPEKQKKKSRSLEFAVIVACGNVCVCVCARVRVRVCACAIRLDGLRVCFHVFGLEHHRESYHSI